MEFLKNSLKDNWVIESEQFSLFLLPGLKEKGREGSREENPAHRHHMAKGTQTGREDHIKYERIKSGSNSTET